MLNKFLTVFLLLSTVFVNTNAQYAYATDVMGSFSVSQFRCIKSNGYSAIFTQIYSAANGGLVDATGSQNVLNAYQAGLGTEVYINPAPKSTKQSYVQFDESYKQLRNANINVRTIWLKVTDPVLWYQNPSYNINFIQGMITRARNYGITLGIFTNWYDWYQITASTTTFQQYNLPLWYWDVYGFGPSAEGSRDFSDFRSFGSWTSASAKEYALTEWLCSAAISKVVYFKSNSNLKLLSDKNMTQPVAGSAIF
uniref:Glycoside hydrolase n=1 Tax=Strongyloides papillosus TaxID=174720 RepID=A0A0N5BT78_STREA